MKSASGRSFVARWMVVVAPVCLLVIVIEGNETCGLKLASPVGASLSDSSALGRTTNDD